MAVAGLIFESQVTCATAAPGLDAWQIGNPVRCHSMHDARAYCHPHGMTTALCLAPIFKTRTEVSTQLHGLTGVCLDYIQTYNAACMQLNDIFRACTSSLLHTIPPLTR